jgi:DNA repair photolyase
VNSYSSGVGKGRRRPRFIETLKKDIADFKALGMPPGPVHVSNSTDLFQEELEKRFGDTDNTLKIIAENRDLFSEITILTKNPCMAFEETAYLNCFELMKDKLNIEITIPFFRDNYRLYEPHAPHPHARLDAMNKLSQMGFNVRLRLDPIFPAGSGIQTKDDIDKIFAG